VQDLPLVLQWHNDPELYATLGGPFRYVSLEAEEQWFRRILDARDQVNLAICSAATGEHIGNIYLRDIDWISRRGELHAFIAAPGCRGKGYGTDAVQQLLKYAFCDLGLQRIFLHVLADNEAAIAVYSRCGFTVEGRLRQHAFKHGAYRDVLVMGICHEPPAPLVPRGRDASE
jgi:RimJ/RimL family protein N-acetyltransferase